MYKASFSYLLIFSQQSYHLVFGENLLLCQINNKSNNLSYQNLHTNIYPLLNYNGSYRTLIEDSSFSAAKLILFLLDNKENVISCTQFPIIYKEKRILQICFITFALSLRFEWLSLVKNKDCI